jgi:predicted outer membrane repeat protein
MRNLSFILIMAMSLQAQTFNVSTTAELRDALTNAAGNGEDDTIILADGVYKTTDDGSGTFEYLDNEVYNLTLKGTSRENVKLDGDTQDRIFRHSSIAGANLYLEKLTFANGKTSGNGGAILTDKAALSIVDCNFSNNQALSGGGFYKPNRGNLNITNTVFENNKAIGDYNSNTGYGGGFYAEHGYPTINNSSFINNSASGNYESSGGGFYITSEPLSITKSLFYKNASHNGGGFYAASLKDVDDCNFTENSALFLDNNNNNAGQGGGFYSNGAGDSEATSVTNSIFEKNQAGSDGGGLYIQGESKILNSSFIKNKLIGTDTDQGGAGVFAGGVISQCLFQNNYSVTNGGAITFDGIVTNSMFINNYAKLRGGTIQARSKLYIANSLFNHNNSGIAYYNHGTVENPDVLKNNLFLDTNDSILGLTYDGLEPIISIENNYINLDKVNSTIRVFKKNNLDSNASLGFVDGVNGDYNLTAASDLIDAGTKDYADKFIYWVDKVNYLATDYADNNRSVGANMDIGIYEYTTTKPTLNDINITGTKKQFQELTFGVDYTLASGRSIQSVEFDYLNDGTYTTDNIHSFDKVRTYKVNIKVTDDAGEFSTTSVSVKIDALPFADMTNEQKYKEAIQSDYYSDIITIIEDEISTANTSGHELGLYDGKVYVQNHLAEFNLTTLESCNQSLEDMNTTATQVGIDTGKAYVQNNLAEFNLTTLESCNQSLEDMNTTATQVGIDTGKAYVQNNLAEFSLVTLTDKVAAVNSAIAETNTTATAAGILSGKQMVIDSPEAYGLILQSDLNSSVTDALNKGIASGKKYVLDNLEEFSLVAKADIDFTATDIASLGTGWSLVSTPFAISDLSIFDSVNIIWVYNNTTGKWAAYSSDATIKQKIEDKADVDTLTTIPAGSAIWIMK